MRKTKNSAGGRKLVYAGIALVIILLICVIFVPSIAAVAQNTVSLSGAQYLPGQRKYEVELQWPQMGQDADVLVVYVWQPDTGALTLLSTYAVAGQTGARFSFEDGNQGRAPVRLYAAVASQPLDLLLGLNGAAVEDAEAQEITLPLVAPPMVATAMATAEEEPVEEGPVGSSSLPASSGAGGSSLPVSSGTDSSYTRGETDAAAPSSAPPANSRRPSRQRAAWMAAASGNEPAVSSAGSMPVETTTAVDSSGSEQQEEPETITLYRIDLPAYDGTGNLAISDVQFYATGARGTSNAVNGDIVVLRFAANHKTTVQASAYAQTGLQYVSGDGEYEAGAAVSIHYRVTGRGLALGAKLTFYAQLKDEYGNVHTLTSADYEHLSVFYGAAVSYTSFGFAKTANADAQMSVQNARYVKKGDEVTFTLDTIEDLQFQADTSYAGISTQRGAASCTVDTEASPQVYHWKIKFTVPELAGAQEIQALPFYLEFVNANANGYLVFNHTQSAAGQALLYYPGLTVQNASMASAVAYPQEVGETTGIAMAGDTVVITFETSRPVTVVSCKKASNGVVLDANPQLELAGTSGGVFTYKMRYTVQETDGFVDEWPIDIRLALRDEAGNETTLVQNSVTYMQRAAANTYEITVENPDGYTPAHGASDACYVSAGDRVTATLTTTQRYAGGNRYRLEIQGNTYAFTYRGRTRVDGVHIYTYTVSNVPISWNDAQDVTQLPYRLLLADGSAADESTGAYQARTRLLYCAAPAYESFSMRAQYAGAESVTQFARRGSTVTASIVFNQPVELQNVTMMGYAASGDAQALNDGGEPTNPPSGRPYYYHAVDAETGEPDYRTWQVVLTLPEDAAGQDDADIPLTFSVRAFTGRTMVEQSLETIKAALPHIQPVRYWAPIVVTPRVEVSPGAPGRDGSGVQVTKNGDTVTVSIATAHAVRVTSARLGPFVLDAGAFVPADADEGYMLQASFRLNQAPLALAAGLQDQQEWALDVEVKDDLLQTGQHTGSGDAAEARETLLYYAPIRISDLQLRTGNSKDGSAYAKTGDEVSVSFVANHAVAFEEAAIAGKAVHITSVPGADGSVAYTMKCTVYAGDLADQAQIGFSFTVGDKAQNTPVSATQANVGNSVTFYAPLTASSHIHSNNRNQSYAKNGDVVNVNITPNHRALVLQGTVGGRGAGGTGTYSEALSMQYTIPTREASLAEGVLSYSFLLEDPAGNTLEIGRSRDDSGRTVTYDRTAPVVTITPVFSGFSATFLQFSVHYSDESLDMAGVTLTLNGKETIGAGERSARTEYTKTVSLDEDGEYRIYATATDMAGNTGRLNGTLDVIVDTMKPVIRLRLDMDTFPAGFQLEQLFTIDEEYIKDVTCTVTDLAGVQDWSLEEPMETEGRKTVYLSVTDMAGNVSVPVTCDIYIDATAPTPFIRSENVDVSVRPGAMGIARGPVQGVLTVGLEALHLGSEEPDRFTVLQLLDEAGNVLTDFLAQGADDRGTFTFTLEAHGTYTILIEAEDGVGNRTGQLRYSFEYRDYTLAEILQSEVPAAQGTMGRWIYSHLWMVILPVVVIGAGAVLLMRLYRKRKN